jgi:hypothetical protein
MPAAAHDERWLRSPAKLTVWPAARREQRPQLGALPVSVGHLDGDALAEMPGAHIDADAGGDAQQGAPLDVGVGREGLAFAALDRCLCENRFAKDPAQSRSDTRQWSCLVLGT